MSALELEPQYLTGLTLATSEAVVATFPVAGATLDIPLSAISQRAYPFRLVRIRGIIVVSSAVATHFVSVRLRQGNNTVAGPQVGQTLSQQTATTDPTSGAFVAFEWVDSSPTTLYYSLTATMGTAATGQAIINVTGFTV